MAEKDIKISCLMKRHDIITGEDETIKNSYDGKLKSIGSTHYVFYTEKDEEGIETANRLKVTDCELVRECKGRSTSVMNFFPSRETTTNYVTMYGTFAMRFMTRFYKRCDVDNGMDIYVEYVMSMDDKPSADCTLKIELRW